MRHLITFVSSEKRPFLIQGCLNVVLNSAVRLHEYKFDGFYQFLLNTRPFARKKNVKTANFAKPFTCQQSVMTGLYVLKNIYYVLFSRSLYGFRK